jgi:exodeoxyribonuclease III
VRIATWNVNSLRARQDLVVDWLRREQPDVLCMQETKVTDAEFPSDELQRLGYSVASAGQKTYNGVAIAAKLPLRDVRVGLHDVQDSDAKRLISASVGTIRVFCCYVPNGRSVESEAFQDKLSWLERLLATLEAWHKPQDEVVVCGDFNIAADARDLYDVKAFEGKTHFHPEEHARLRRLLAWGLVDTFRIHTEAGEQFSWWDYRAGAFRRNLGMRIDYVFASQSLASRCRGVRIDVEERRKTAPSDHAPVIADFAEP